AVVLDRPPEGRFLAEDVLLADELLERPRPESLGERRDGGSALLRRVREEVAHLRGSMLRRVAQTEDFSQPILPGDAPSDYERYLRTDELLALQKAPEEMAHPDELLFQTVHQSSELWLKFATSEVARATEDVRSGDVPSALRLLRRAAIAVQY